MTERKKKNRPSLRLAQGMKQLEQAILSSPSPEEMLKELLEIAHASSNKILSYNQPGNVSHHKIDGLDFQALVESLNDWIWKVDESGVYTYVSPQVKNLLGYEPNEVLGKTPFDFMPDEEARRVRNLFMGYVKKCQPFYALENTNRTRGGDLIVLETSGVPVFDQHGRFRGYQGVDREITERVAIEKELRKSKDRLQNILETSTDVIWEMNLAGEHTYANHKLEHFLGYKPEETEGIEYEHFLHPDDLKQVKETLPELISQKKGWKGWVLRWRHKNGGYRYWESNAQPIFNEFNEVVGFRGTDRDITKRKANEMALTTATQAAEDAIRTKDLFLASMSHELRTPMTSIIGFGELLAETDLTPEQKTYIEVLNRSSRHLSSLINDIFDLSKIDTGKLTISIEEFSLRKLVTVLIEAKKELILQKGLSVDFSIEKKIPDRLVGDESRIMQILINLLGNAIKFTKTGTIQLNLTLAEDSQQTVLLDIAVKDTGLGIPADFLKKIFEPFSQMNSNIDQSQEGAGLGLTISQRLAELMGGTLRCESQENVGSTFHFIVPLKKTPENTSELSCKEEGPIIWDGPSLKVLLAEDNATSALYIQSVLHKMGHEVKVVENGKFALDALVAGDFDLVLMDIQMPIMNGVDALKALRRVSLLKVKDIPVVALTAFALIGDQEKYLNMGFDGYLSKPFNSQELINTLNKIMSHRVPGKE